jgi:hypothetical protein
MTTASGPKLRMDPIQITCGGPNKDEQKIGTSEQTIGKQMGSKRMLRCSTLPGTRAGTGALYAPERSHAAKQSNTSPLMSTAKAANDYRWARGHILSIAANLQSKPAASRSPLHTALKMGLLKALELSEQDLFRSYYASSEYVT